MFKSALVICRFVSGIQCWQSGSWTEFKALSFPKDLISLFTFHLQSEVVYWSQETHRNHFCPTLAQVNNHSTVSFLHQTVQSLHSSLSFPIDITVHSSTLHGGILFRSIGWKPDFILQNSISLYVGYSIPLYGWTLYSILLYNTLSYPAQ